MKWLPVFSFILPSVVLAWNGSDHQAMGRLSLEEVASDWGLKNSVPVHPLRSLLDKLPPERGDGWHFAEWLGINPAIDLEKPVPELEGRPSATPLEILSFYSIDPDDGRDQDLLVRNERGEVRPRYPDQRWFGGVEGPNSQAFRHIEKPPFNWRNPTATFGFPLRAVGEATRRAEIWYQLSLLAFSLGEDYWGWRFLANSFHYLQDLHNPYHSAQVTPSLLLQGILGYLQWGHRKKGLIGTTAHLVANSHRYFEAYVAVGGIDPPLKEPTLRALGGSDLMELPTTSVKEIATGVRDQANRLFPDLVALVSRLSDPKLRGSYEFRSDPPDADDPLKFVTLGPETTRINHRLFEVTEGQFQSVGRVLRTMTRLSLDSRATESPEVWLKKVNSLLSS